MLIYMFYVLPFFFFCIYGLVLPGCSWLPDWSLVFAGAVAQVRAAPPSCPGCGGHAGTPVLGFCPERGTRAGRIDPCPQLHVEQFPPLLPDNYFGLSGS